MSSPQMTRMLGFLSAACAVTAAHSSAATAVNTARCQLRSLLRITVLTSCCVLSGLLLEREDALPVVLHADNGPALLLCLVVQCLSESSDLGVSHREPRPVAGLRVLQHLLVSRGVTERSVGAAADH